MAGLNHDLDRRLYPWLEPDCSPDEWNQQRLIDPKLAGSPSWQQIRTHNLTHQYGLDLGTDLSAARTALLARAVAVQVQLELVESRMVIGFALPSDYSSLATLMLRLLKELGLDRRQRDVTPKTPGERILAFKRKTEPEIIEEVRMPAWHTGSKA